MYYIIVNPASRSGKGITIWDNSVKPLLDAENLPYEVYFSKQAGDVTKLAEQISGSVQPEDTLIILGGDGTVNEALQGIKDPRSVTFGYIPTGSSNDLARDLKIPKDPKEALDIILHSGAAVETDLGVIYYEDGATRRFTVSCGIGFDAAVCQESMISKLKKTFNKIGLGKLTYMGIALKQIFTNKKASCDMTLSDGTSIHMDRFLFVAGMIHRFEGGGFKFCPDADASDGLLDLCAVGDVSTPLVLVALPTAFFGKHYMFNGIAPYRSSEFSVKASAPLWVHTDGEVTRQADAFRVTCEHGAFRIILPRR